MKVKNTADLDILNQKNFSVNLMKKKNLMKSSTENIASQLDRNNKNLASKCYSDPRLVKHSNCRNLLISV